MDSRILVIGCSSGGVHVRKALKIATFIKAFALLEHMVSKERIKSLWETSKKVILDCSLENGAIIAANSVLLPKRCL